MKQFLYILFILTSFCVFGKEIVGKVVKVSDGDTITIIDNENQKQKIRLDKIDATELKQPFGIKAKNYLEKLIYQKTVKVIYTKKDRYKRILGIVFCEDKEIG